MQVGGAAWVDAGAVQGGAAGAARLVDPVGAAGFGIEPADGRDDVLARRQQRGDLAAVRHHGCVDDGIGLQREDLVHVVRRDHPDGLATEDLADVLAVLVRRVHPAADQLELRVQEDGLDRRAADATGGPLDDADRLIGPTRVAARRCPRPRPSGPPRRRRSRHEALAALGAVHPCLGPQGYAEPGRALVDEGQRAGHVRRLAGSGRRTEDVVDHQREHPAVHERRWSLVRRTQLEVDPRPADPVGLDLQGRGDRVAQPHDRVAPVAAEPVADADAVGPVDLLRSRAARSPHRRGPAPPARCRGRPRSGCRGPPAPQPVGERFVDRTLACDLLGAGLVDDPAGRQLGRHGLGVRSAGATRSQISRTLSHDGSSGMPPHIGWQDTARSSRSRHCRIISSGSSTR